MADFELELWSRKVSYFWLNTQSLKILCIVILCSVQMYLYVQECKMLYTAFCVLCCSLQYNVDYWFITLIFIHSYSSI